jgi:hypothetical protein
LLPEGLGVQDNKNCKIGKLLSVRMPESRADLLLNAFHAFMHATFSQSSDVGTIIKPISQMRTQMRLRHAN